MPGRWRKPVIIVLLSVLMISVAIPSVAWGAYAYNYGDDEFEYSYDNLLYACDAWTDLGLTWSAYFGWQFTKQTVLANMPYGNGFYATCHGNAGLIADNYGSPIYYWEISNARIGDWKRLVFCDSCYSASNASLANAFGIADGDGDLHCFLGWITLSYDSWAYSRWNYVFWANVGSHKTIYNSALAASYQWQIWNWRFYGNPNWAY